MKETFQLLVKQYIAPLLKKEGFIKKNLNFYCKSQTLTYVINLQNSNGNTYDKTMFYVNCGIYSSHIASVLSMEILEFPKEYQCHYSERLENIAKGLQPKFEIIQKELEPTFIETLMNGLSVALKTMKEIQNEITLCEFMFHQGGINMWEVYLEYLFASNQMPLAKKMIQRIHKQFNMEDRWYIFEKIMRNIMIKQNINLTLEQIIAEQHI